MSTGKEQDRPVKELRLDRVKALIWADETSRGTMQNVTFQRLYRDGEDWKTADSFGRDDLPLVQKIAHLAHTWIYENATQPAEEDSQAAT